MLSLHVGNGTIQLIQGNLVHQQVDAMVNAANPQLAGGAGVDGALHHAAGPDLLRWCQAISPDQHGYRCPTGDVRVTPAGELPARWVIHAVGPIYETGASSTSARDLRSVHDRALQVAAEHGCRSIAFPAISTGAYGYPIVEAAPIALQAAHEFLQLDKSPRDIRFILFRDPQLQAFQDALARWT